MKTVICNIPGKEEVVEAYPVEGIDSSKGKMKFRFAVNYELYKSLEKDDEIHVILLKHMSRGNKSDDHVREFKDELNTVIKEKGLCVEPDYDQIDVPFLDTKDIFADIFRKIIGSIKRNSFVFADITFGSKFLPIIVFCALNFAEKFLDSEIKKIIYGKIEFDKDKQKPRPETAESFNITLLYCLNSLTNTIDCDNSETALKIIDDFLAL